LNAAIVGGALVVALAGCSPSTPRVYVHMPLPQGVDPRITVVSALQRPRIVDSLRAAGFRMAEGADGGEYLLRVSLGTKQKRSSCGALQNVRYELRHEQSTWITAEAKGWTGSCEPNIFDELSRALRRRILATHDREEPTQ
jgi:hypothetical protein